MIMKLNRATAYAPYCFTNDEYYRLGEMNFFGDRRVELIGGEILEVPPQSNWHAQGIEAIADFCRQAFGTSHWIRIQMPLDLSPLSVPDPDVAVILGARSTHTGRANPTDAVLVAEVSESSLRSDQTRKMSLYSAADIPEYWILNLVRRQLEVYRDPVVDPSADFGCSYSTVTHHLPGDSVAPLALPSAAVAVADLFV